MDFRVLNLVNPFKVLVPTVDVSSRRTVALRGKMIYTIMASFFFLICSKFPLFGIHRDVVGDPMYWMRAIMASSRATLMELGTGPIITAGMIMQFLIGSKLVRVNNAVKADRELMKVAEKVLAIFITIGQAVAYVASGMYGPMGITNGILIVAQLLFTTIILLCIDELLDNGYGFGSAVSLFTTTNVCEHIVWKALSPVASASHGVVEMEGALVSLGHGLLRRKNKVKALREAFFRKSNPNMTNLLATIGVFMMVNYFQGFHVILPFRGGRGVSAPVSIKLFYTSTMPIILQSALVSNYFFISQLLHLRFGNNALVKFLGTWESINGGHFVPVGGLASYLLAPHSLQAMFMHPFQSMVCFCIMLSSCGLFASTWIQVSGNSARDMAKQLRQEKLILLGHRDCNVEKELNRHIPVAAAFGGICIAALTVVADLTGAIGSGTGILLAVTTLNHFLVAYDKEAKRERGY